MEHAFKAKKVTFRERNYGKVEKVDFRVFLRREFAFKIHPGFLWKIRKTLTLGDSYAIREMAGSDKIMEFDFLFLSREISFPFPKK